MQKLSTIEINLLLKGFEAVPNQVTCSKLDSLMVNCYKYKCMVNGNKLAIISYDIS